MKIVFLTIEDTVFGAIILEKLLANKLLVVSSVKSKENILKSAFKMIRKRGFWYFFGKALRILKFKLKGNSIKAIVNKNNLNYLTIADINNIETINKIKDLNPKLIIVSSFDQIIKDELLKVAPVINVHPSFLPDYKGPDPIFWALHDDVNETGVSVHHIVREVDKGDVIVQEKVKIEHDSIGSLEKKLALKGSELLLKVITMFEKGKVSKVKQKSEGSYQSFPKKEDVKALTRNKGLRVLL